MTEKEKKRVLSLLSRGYNELSAIIRDLQKVQKQIEKCMFDLEKDPSRLYDKIDGLVNELFRKYELPCDPLDEAATYIDKVCDLGKED